MDDGITIEALYAELLEEIVELTRQHQEMLDCVGEAEHARTILERGTSDKQALDAVVDWLMEETTRDL